MNKPLRFKEVIPNLSKGFDDLEAEVDKSIVEHIIGNDKDIELQMVWVFCRRYQKSYPFPLNSIYVVREKRVCKREVIPQFEEYRPVPPYLLKVWNEKRICMHRIKQLPRGAKCTWGSPGVYAYKLPPGNMILVGHEEAQCTSLSANTVRA